jgi:glycyl-tRNA synthetase beta chain
MASVLTEAAEIELYRVLSELRGAVLLALADRRYADALAALAGLRAAVDEFFERIMVMDENLEKRNSRLALLRDVQVLLSGVADLSRLPG